MQRAFTAIFRCSAGPYGFRHPAAALHSESPVPPFGRTEMGSYFRAACRNGNEFVFANGMTTAAKTKTSSAAPPFHAEGPAGFVFSLAAKPRPGHQLPTAVLYRAIGPINSGTATSLQTPLYDSGRRSRCTGQERDSETASSFDSYGLDYFGGRYFSGAEGRFTSVDPAFESAILELPQTWNRYSYVYNRPTFGTDPDGRCPICAGAIVGGVVEGGWNLGSQFIDHGYSFSGTDWGKVRRVL